MRRITKGLVIIAALAGLLLGGYVLWDQVTRVSTADLERIVRRDGVPFDGQSIPGEVLDRLAARRVVVLGELHFLREHRDFVAELLPELHRRGFRQYLFEWTQAADWLLDDFVNDGGLMPEWTPPHDIGGVALTAIRDFNRTLPVDERIAVHGIDVHLADYGGADSWLGILGLVAQQLSDPGPVTAFLQANHDTYDSHRAQLEWLRTQLESGRTELAASWGDYWYDTVVEMVDVELRSAAVRAIRDSDYDASVRQREAAIKWLADRRINSTPHGTLINMGATHVQKETLFGTEIE